MSTHPRRTRRDESTRAQVSVRSVTRHWFGRLGRPHWRLIGSGCGGALGRRWSSWCVAFRGRLWRQTVGARLPRSAPTSAALIPYPCRAGEHRFTGSGRRRILLLMLGRPPHRPLSGAGSICFDKLFILPDSNSNGIKPRRFCHTRRKTPDIPQSQARIGTTSPRRLGRVDVVMSGPSNPAISHPGPSGNGGARTAGGVDS